MMRSFLVGLAAFAVMVWAVYRVGQSHAPRNNSAAVVSMNTFTPLPSEVMNHSTPLDSADARLITKGAAKVRPPRQKNQRRTSTPPIEPSPILNTPPITSAPPCPCWTQVSITIRDDRRPVAAVTRHSLPEDLEVRTLYDTRPVTADNEVRSTPQPETMTIFAATLLTPATSSHLLRGD